MTVLRYGVFASLLLPLLMSASVFGASKGSSQFVLGGKIVHLHLSGELNQALLNVDDGVANRTFVTTNDHHVSRFKIKGTVDVNQATRVGGVISIGLKANPSNSVTQVAQSAGDTLDLRHADIFIQSQHYGKLSLGKGKTASDGAAEVDYSGTKDAGCSGIQKMVGGIYFRSPGVSIADNPQVTNVLNDLDGFSRKNRLRYDTPYIHGVSLQGSLIEDSRADLALRFKKTIGQTKLGAAIGYTTPQTLSTVRGRWVMGSMSMLCKSGINMTLAGGLIDPVNMWARKAPYYYYFKPGYQAKLNQWGKTAFSVDYGQFFNYNQSNDKAQAIGVQVEQYVDVWRFAVYAGYRHLSLSRSGTSYRDMNAVMLGGRLNFG